MLCEGRGICTLVGALSLDSVLFGMLFGVAACVACASLVCWLRPGCHAESAARASRAGLCITVLAAALVFGAVHWQHSALTRAETGPLPKVCPWRLDYLRLAIDGGQRPCSMTSHWQYALTSKVVGGAFAMQLGVKAPRIFYFGTLDNLPAKWPASWGSRFVFKPLTSHSSQGVLLLHDEYDLMTGERFAGRDDVQAMFRPNSTASCPRPPCRKRWQKTTHSLSSHRRKPVIVEEMLVGLSGGAAADYKFYMFGERIGAMYVAWGRSSGNPCYAWFADDLQTRIDERCVINYRSSLYGEYYTGSRRPRLRHCTSDGCPGTDLQQLAGVRVCPPDASPPPLSPELRDELRATAIKLGRAAGIPFRVDLYVTTKGVMLGEFTCNPFGFQFHCAVPTVNGTADPCHLGRVYSESGGAAMGQSIPVPQGLLNMKQNSWKKLATSTGWQRQIAFGSGLLLANNEAVASHGASALGRASG